jgi:CubicO group peptidase (beta-lactamase class C family)
MKNLIISKNPEELKEFLQEKMKEWNVPGMAAAVIKDGEILFEGELGLRDVKQNRNVTKDTLFAIGSASKAFTSLAIAMLVEEGILDFDAPIKKYIPEFEMKNKYAGEHITLRDMLCHRSGLPRHDMVWLDNTSLIPKDLVAKMKHLDLSKDFRETWQYNNLMYIIIGYVIELVTKMSWSEFIKARIFEPLGMNNSNFSVEVSKKSSDYSLPYALKGNGVQPIEFRNLDQAQPAGGINSTLTDMIKWLMFHLEKGKVNGTQIVSEKNILQMHSTQIPCKLVPWDFNEVQFSSYGLGWFVESYRGRKHVHHAGNIDGFSSYVSFLPDENLGIVILSNTNTPFWTIPITYSIYDRILGDELVDWSGMIKSEFTKAMESMTNVNKTEIQSQEEDIKPSHSIDNFTGMFENPGYGTIHIERQGECLNLIYNNVEYRLKHIHDDIFTMTMNEIYNITINFYGSSKKSIDYVSIPFEQSVKEIQFKKRSK